MPKSVLYDIQFTKKELEAIDKMFEWSIVTASLGITHGRVQRIRAKIRNKQKEIAKTS